MTLMRNVIASVEQEYVRYKRLAEGAMAQVEEKDLGRSISGALPIAAIARHIGGNLKSRFTEFLTADGEKPWRDRESEFVDRSPARSELLDHWEAGWQELLATLSELSDDQLNARVTIRGEALTVLEALHRSLAHTSYHVGQIVLVAKAIRGESWRYLSIPPVVKSR